MAASYKKKTYEEKKEEVQELLNKMEKSVETYYESPEDMREYLLFMSRFHQYSLGNVSLIRNQFSGAQAVGSFKFWREQGYSVNKGEKGMKILVPQQVQAKFRSEDGTWKLLKDASDKEKELIEQKKLKSIPNRTVFGVGHVFDVSQTNCPTSDLPKIFPNKWLEGEIQNYKGFMDALTQVADSIRFKIEPPQHELGAAKGVCYPLDHVISLNPRNSEFQNVTTLIHELAHAQLHTIDKFHDYSTSEKEFQAEMVSYVVSAYFGLDNEDSDKKAKSMSYISHWTKGKELKDKSKLLQEVRETTNEFINMIEKNFTKEKNQEVEKKQELEKSETETLYWYEMLHRPVDMGCQPKGFVETKDDQGRHGLVAYSRPLTEKELDEYEMRKWSQDVYLIDLTDTIKQSFKQMPLDKLKEHYDQKEIPDSSFIKAFNETNKERYFILSEDKLKEPMVLIKWSEHARLQSSELIPLSVANPLFQELNKTEFQEDGGYFKTRYSVLLPDKEHGLDLLSPDRYDIGDGYYVDILDQLKKDGLLKPNQEKVIQTALNMEQGMEIRR